MKSTCNNKNVVIIDKVLDTIEMINYFEIQKAANTAEHFDLLQLTKKIQL